MHIAVKVVAESYVKRIWDDKDLSAIDDLMTADVVIHSSLGIFHGRESMKQVVSIWYRGFPDLIVENIAVICEGDLGVVQWNARGTHRGEFKGIRPTGKRVIYSGVTLYRIKNGKICEYWAYLDMQHVLKQLQ